MSQGLAVLDAHGRHYYGTGEQLGDLAALIRTHLSAQVAGSRPAQALAWTGGGEAWMGSLSLVSAHQPIPILHRTLAIRPPDQQAYVRMYRCAKTTLPHSSSSSTSERQEKSLD
jgi:hypothetical protein